MPESGRLNPNQIETVEHSGATAAPWTVTGAGIHAVTFEVDTGAALNALPPMLSRPAPTYGRIYVIDYPDTPLGAYREALLMVSCRYLMMPRQYLVASIVDSEAARAANAQNSHYRSEIGKITLQASGNSATSTIEGASGLKVIITSPDGASTSSDVLRYDPVVVVQPREGGLKVLTVSGAPENIREAFIAAGTTMQLQGGGADSPWVKLRSMFPITGTFARLDVEVPLAKEVEMPPMMAAAAARSSS